MYTFIPNKSLGQLLDISPKKIAFLKTFNSEFLYIEVWFTYQISKPLETWFTYQISKPLETEDKMNITLVIN